jgi:hypothetical protein
VFSEVAFESSTKGAVVGNERIVLNILIADLQRCGLARFMLVENEVIKVMDELFILVCHDLLQRLFLFLSVVLCASSCGL